MQTKQAIENKRLLQNSDFIKLWGGQTISEFGSRITREGIPLVAALSLNASPFEMGILAAAGGVPVIIVGLQTGVWVDRMYRRPVMILADLGRAVILLSIPLAALLQRLSLVQLFIVAALSGLFTFFFDVADRSYLPTLVTREHVVEANSKLAATSSLAEIGGPALAGSLVQFLTAPVAIFFDALSFLFSALSVFLIQKPEPRPVTPKQSKNLWREVLEGMNIITGNQVLRVLVESSALRNFFGRFFSTLYIIYAVRDLHLTPVLLGFTIAMGGVGSLIGAVIAAPLMRRIGLGSTLVWSALISSFISLLIPLASGPLVISFAFLMVTQLISDMGMEIYSIHEVSLRQTIVPNRLMGRANASVNFLLGGLGLAGALTAGALAEATNLRITVLIAVIGFIFCAFRVFFSPVRNLQVMPDYVDSNDEAGY